MLSIEECRKLLDNECELTDEQVLQLRDALYELANISLDSYFQVRG